METKDVIAFRQNFDKATVTMYNKFTGEKREFKPAIHICCDNSLNAIDDRFGSVIWDDENERFYWFKLNSPGSHPLVNLGYSLGSEVEYPIVVIAVDYGEIQNMRIVMNRESFNKFTQDALGDLITPEQIAYLKHEFFDSTDMKIAIPKAKQYSYMTEEQKDSPRSTKHYDTLDEYRKTVQRL